jgi:hypothetical protein
MFKNKRRVPSIAVLTGQFTRTLPARDRIASQIAP